MRPTNKINGLFPQPRPAGPDVFSFTASVDEHPTPGVTYEDEDGTMPQDVTAHHRTRNRVDYPIIGIDDVDEFNVTDLGHPQSVTRCRHVD